MAQSAQSSAASGEGLNGGVKSAADGQRAASSFPPSHHEGEEQRPIGYKPAKVHAIHHALICSTIKKTKVLDSSAQQTRMTGHWTPTATTQCSDSVLLVVIDAHEAYYG